MEKIKCVYAGFDALDASFFGKMPMSILEKLKAAKLEAGEARALVAIELGGVAVQVYETGQRGGYAFKWTTGEAGETWVCKGDALQDGDWQLRVSVNAAAFVDGIGAGDIGGQLGEVMAGLSDKLKAWGFEAMRSPQGHFESVSRIDFAMDFLMQDFVLDPALIASKGSKTGYMEGATAHWSGRRVTGLTVGKMPARQVVIYDKIADTVKKQKDYWFKVWGLDPEDKPEVWRIELRAGKKLLNGQYGLRTFDDIARAAGDVFSDTLRKVRLVDPTDTNITRCESSSLWKAAELVMRDGLKFAFSGLASGQVIETTKARLTDTLRKMWRGVALTMAAVKTKGFNEVQIVAMAEDLAADIRRLIVSDKTRVQKHIREARGRYVFLCEDEWRKAKEEREPEWMQVKTG